jgi:hypothetical protein
VNVSCNLLEAWNDLFLHVNILIFICNSRVFYRVRVTRQIKFTRAGAGMGAFSYPCAGAGNPTGTI